MSDAKKVQAYQQGDSSGYGRVPQPGLPTYTEAWALIEAARRMAAASDNANQSDIKDRNRVRDALRLNWRLWTIFQAEMTVDNTSNLPDDVRTNMLTLCKFVDKHTVEALKDPVPGKISTLIDINRNIASGLLASLENANKGAAEAEGGESNAESASSDEAKAAAEAIANLNTKV
ncbi:MAG: flagellar biosynthesis regulator FlaF [Rhodospirillales bacterium]